MTTTRSTKAAALAAGAALAMTLAACGSNSDDPKSDTSNTASSPSTAASKTPEDRAMADAQKAVERYIDVGNQVAQGDAEPSALKSVTVDPLLSAITSALEKAPKNQEITGEQRFTAWKNLKTSLTSSASLTPTVQLSVCIDYRDVTTKVNGKVLGPNERPGGKTGSLSYDYTVENNKYPGGSWKVANFKQGAEGCATAA